ncbi:hypothetical protein [Planomonospora sp. ID67723]|uniref:hypothetical protein n=1 Tax=Planomonospora sp. ID67723 TaxID=2738134 RepID=UPI0018C361C9|nr:hypothetical protein [Planomonospora sp. ID67723]
MVFTALPAEGYRGGVPEFPLPDPLDREIEVWEEAWATPQAAAWSVQPWRWRTVAMWVRWSVRMEAEDASAALGNVVVRFADQIGLTPAGLKENGWKIAEDDLAAKRQDKDDEPAEDAEDVRSRFKVVTNGAGG